ncbi:hypothetical protein BLNAU_1173 [Blattamonas nauphoetae]|uniref:Uncharacterized protein n=1 Tax=Blattamonas nauphoetae TaxID=2049346 RepID=A0ABQ9YIP8_9EUKA|nr:hypothetical protein BLNAU_1173 [Blattamonas nauphoetae]
MISSLLETLQCDDEEIIVSTLRELQKMATGDFIISTFKQFGESSPPPAVITTLARISLFPHLRISHNSQIALYNVIERDPPALTLLPSPIFPSSCSYQQYSELSFLTALTKQCRIVFSEFQSNLPTNPSDIQQYTQLTKDDPYLITRALNCCSYSSGLPNLLLSANPPIEVDLEIIRELILFVKEGLTTILTNISNIDNLIISLLSDSSPTTQLVSGVDPQIADSLHQLRDDCHKFLNDSWGSIVGVTFNITDPHRSSFQQVILDDPSFTDLILNSLQLTRNGISNKLLRAIRNIIISFPLIKEQFMAANLVGRMFATVDFVSFPLSESETLFELTIFFASMFIPIGADEDAQMRTMVEMEYEDNFQIVFLSLLNSTYEWKRNKPDRQKRRDVLYREEGWDDTIELRVVGMEKDTHRDVQSFARELRIELRFNTDRP